MLVNRITPFQMKTTTGHKEPQPSFQANPQDILDILGKSGICPCKKMYVSKITGFFANLQEKLKLNPDFKGSYTYKLTEKNTLPDEIADIEIGGETLVTMNKKLTEDVFKCSNGGCSSGTKSLGGFLQNMYETMGVNEPSFIKLTK